jgi:hypothetical protein
LQRRRRSTSDGIVTFGEHCFKSYSQTQETIALSSRESVFYGIVKVATVGLGAKGLLSDMEINAELQVYTDSRVAGSIASRRGVGKVKCVNARQLRGRDRAAKGELVVRKAKGERNMSDVLTKRILRMRLDSHLDATGFRRRVGRHELCPHLRGLVLRLRRQKGLLDRLDQPG